MKKIIIASELLLALLLVYGCSQTVQTTTAGQVPASGSQPVQAAVTGQDQAAGSQGGNVVSFGLTGENFKFSMDGQDAPVLTVKEGDTVKITLTSAGGFHDWVLDEFNAHTDRVNTGQSASVEFVADKKGTFEYYCSVDSHRQKGMKGTFIVE